jgi:enoyl-CoA hydratase/carnithine racemase
MLRSDVKPPVAWLALDRPDKLNAMTRDFFGELAAAIRAAEDDDTVRVVVLHGAGGCFSVGGDIVAFGELAGVDDRRAYVREALESFRAVEECG